MDERWMVGGLLAAAVMAGCSVTADRAASGALVGTLRPSGSVAVNGRAVDGPVPLFSGDRVGTAVHDGSAVIAFTDGGMLALDRDTRASFEVAWSGLRAWEGDCAIRVLAVAGRVYADGEGGRCTIALASPDGEWAIGAARAEWRVEPQRTRLAVLEGTAWLRQPRAEAIAAGQQGEVAQGTAAVGTLVPEDRAELLRWRARWPVPQPSAGRATASPAG